MEGTFMKAFYELIKVILPPIIAGFFTFLVTKYTYNKKIPLDKMEVAYNRIYYPIFKILYEKKEFVSSNVGDVISKIQPYLKKYSKYADRATMKAFKMLKENKDKYSYDNFASNIYERNMYLRRRLGYLEPNLLQIYTYSSKNEKSIIRIFSEILLFYFTFVAGGLTEGNLQKIITVLVLCFTILIIFEIFIIFIRWVIKAIKKIFHR